jgi:hypothetical protein
MDVIFLYVKLNKLRFKVIAHISEDNTRGVKDTLTENTTPVFRNKYQMHMEDKDAISASVQSIDIAVIILYTFTL